MVHPFAKYAAMIDRPFWQNRLERAWQEAPITGRAYAKRSQGLELTVCGLDRLQ
jgi:hypothetical protein